MSSSSLMANRLALLKKELNKTILVAVSKRRSLEEITQLYQHGQRDFGENRVQELEDKAKRCIYPDLLWHFIGPLQANKLSKLLGIKGLKAIHSVESLKLLKKICEKQDKVAIGPIDIYLQVDSTGEENKHGFKTFDELQLAYDYFIQQKPDRLMLKGLMGMSKILTENFLEDARQCFRLLKSYRDKLDPRLELNMGMSRDYRIALEEGSNMVRIGSALFD